MSMSHVVFLTKTHPWFQSFFPTGISYDLTIPIEERVRNTYNVCKMFLTLAEKTGVSHVGQLGRPVRYTPVGLLQRYLEHGTFSADRKKWRTVCDGLKVWSAVDEWSIGESKDDTKLWDEFRVAMKAFLKVDGNRDQSKTVQPAERNVAAREIRKASIDERRAQLKANPEYIEFMTVQFPEWMSMTPGGQNYRMDDYPDISSRAVRWHNATNRLIVRAQEIGCSTWGGVGQVRESAGDNDRTVRYSVASELRRMRNSWKKEMRQLELPQDDTMWRLPDARSGVWTDEWKQFHAMVKELFWDGKYTW